MITGAAAPEAGRISGMNTTARPAEISSITVDISKTAVLLFVRKATVVPRAGPNAYPANSAPSTRPYAFPMVWCFSARSPPYARVLAV